MREGGRKPHLRLTPREETPFCPERLGPAQKADSFGDRDSGTAMRSKKRMPKRVRLPLRSATHSSQSFSWLYRCRAANKLEGKPTLTLDYYIAVRRVIAALD